MVHNNQLVYGESKKRLESIFDAGTFVELGAFTKRNNEADAPVGVVCGYGAVNGNLVFAFSQDSTRYLHRIAGADGIALNAWNLE